MGRSFKIANIAGFQIYINWTWILIIALMTWGLGDYYHTLFPSFTRTTDYVLAFISAILLFVTVLLHELGHSVVARSRGLPVNTITLFFFGGVSNLTREPESAGTEFYVAAAGPLVSLILSGIFYVIYAIFTSLPLEVRAVIGYLAWINLILALFNLIPAFPLDGGRIFRSILWGITKSRRRATKIAVDVSHAFGILFILAGLAEAFLAGAVLSGIYLAVLGWFLQSAASATYQQTVADTVLQGVDVHDVMDHAASPVPPNTPLEALVYRHMMEENARAIPVTAADNRLLGLVTLSDVRHVPRDKWGFEDAQQVMTPIDKLVTVTPDEDLRSAVQKLARDSYHQLPVVRNGILVGMLNRAHVMSYLHMREQLGAQRHASGPASPSDRRAS